MRKHRLFGVAFAALVVAGPLGYQTGALRPTAGVDLGHVGISLASADIPARVRSETSTEPSTAPSTEKPAAPPAEPSTGPPGAGIASGFLVLRTSLPGPVEALWSLKAGRAAEWAPPPPSPAPEPTATAAPAIPSRPAPEVALVAARPATAPAASPGGGSSGVWEALRQCESNGNYADDTGNGYYGAYQFSLATWRALGQSGLPSQAPAAVQDLAAQRLQKRSGWGQWPVCSRRLGLL